MFKLSDCGFQIKKIISRRLWARRAEVCNLKIKFSEQGFTLFELIVTLTVLAILVMGTIPMAQNAVKRQREIRLRESLRMIRSAIDEFKRDTVGACPQGSSQTSNPTDPRNRAINAPADPRSRVVIDDCKIFEASQDNFDRYPPSLDILVEGVRVKPRGGNIRQQSSAFSEENATEINEEKEITKVYLREIPEDPMTGKKDTWELRSSYQAADSSSWDSNNVFDVRSGSDEEALNGEKYSDW